MFTFFEEEEDKDKDEEGEIGNQLKIINQM